MRSLGSHILKIGILGSEFLQLAGVSRGIFKGLLTGNLWVTFDIDSLINRRLQITAGKGRGFSMDKIYVCRTCGFSVREIELAEWSKHDFVNKDHISPDKIPDYDVENNCENFEIWDERSS